MCIEDHFIVGWNRFAQNRWGEATNVHQRADPTGDEQSIAGFPQEYDIHFFSVPVIDEEGNRKTEIYQEVNSKSDFGVLFAHCVGVRAENGHNYHAEDDGTRHGVESHAKSHQQLVETVPTGLYLSLGQILLTSQFVLPKSVVDSTEVLIIVVSSESKFSTIIQILKI